MRFDKLVREKQVPLHADGRQRWAAVSPDRMEALTGRKWLWVRNVQDPLQRRTILTLGIDQAVPEDSDPRPVSLRTVVYRPGDLRDAQQIQQRRTVLTNQLLLLNRLKSPLLPEPLDWIEVENLSDGFGPRVPARIRQSEPVMVLAWQGGRSLEYSLREPSGWRRLGRVARLARRLVRWLAFLDQNGVAWFNMHASNILIGANDVPRLLGLSGLCPVDRHGHPDETHPGFLRTAKGTFPPEFSDQSGGSDAARGSTPMAIGAFGLGVLIAQMAAVTPQISPKWLERGTFSFDAWRRESELVRSSDLGAIVDLVEALCRPDPAHRLTDAAAIREWLDPIAGDRTRYQGVIRWTNINARGELYGFIGPDPDDGSDPNDDEQIYFNARQLSRELSELADLTDAKVSFSVREHKDGNKEAFFVRPRA